MEATDRFICEFADKISMPSVYQNIRKLMEKQEATIEDYEQVVSSDPMLATRMIRIANSEFFGFKRKARDLHEALSLVGVIQLHDLLLSTLCMRAFYGIPEEILNFQEFWRHNIKCGIAALSIGKYHGLLACNRLFTLGLLLEIGHALMFIKAPELALKSFLDGQRQYRTVNWVEQDVFGFDYCQLGAALMHRWHLPEVYQETVRHHLDPAQADDRFRTEVEIANLAHQFAQPSLKIDYLDSETIKTIQFIQIPESIKEGIIKQMDEHVDEVFELLTPPGYAGRIKQQKEYRHGS